MQKGVPNNALDQQHQSHGGQSSVTTVPDTTVQHYVLANPLTSLATQPGSALSTLNIQGSQRPTSQIVTSTNPLQQQAVVVASEDLGRLLNSVQSQGSTPVLRQLSGQGILSVVGPRGQPVSFHGGTLVTDQTGELQICQQPLTALVTTTSTSATSAISISGGTVHHLGQSPSRGGSIPHTNLQPKLLTMSAQQSGQQQQSQTPQRNVAAAGSSSSAIAAAGRVLMEAKPSSGLSLTFPNLTALANQSSMTGPSPKKKVKVEEKTAVSQEVSNNRKLVLDLKYKDMQEVKENYIDCLTEMFFLQNGGNMMDFFTWKKRPTPQLVHFLKSGNLDSDEEEDHGQERKINNEVKVITCSGSNVPIATPVAISTTLPPSVAALNQQGCDPRRPGGRHGMVFGHVQPLAQNVTPVQSAIVMPGSVSVLSGTSSTVITTTSSAAQLTSTTTVATPSITSTAVSMPQLQSQLTRVISESKPLTVQTNLTPKSTILSPSTSQSIKSSKSPPLSPSRLHTRQHTISAVYDDSLGVGTQEAIVERAKQEAQVMQRVAELRKEGLWSTRRLPKVQEPPRNKGHWDYLLEEMQWLAADFAQERKWKKAAARKLAKMVSKYFQELEQKEIKAEKEEAQKLKKIAGQIAKQVREFWTNIEKVVQYKQQARMDEKRKKALDLHLNFIVDQTEKYSTWLTEGLQKGSRAGSSVSGSVLVTPDNSSDGGDDEFEPEDHESDDEETIEKEEEEAGIDEVSTKEEIDALQKESELPIEELLKTLPPEVLDKPASLSGDQEADDEAEDKDKEFKVEEDAADEEDTIAEQEKHEKKIDYSKELKDLQDENDLSVEDLYKKYAEAYASDYEMSEEEDETDSEDESEEEEESDDEEEEEDEEDQEMKEEKDVGLEYLMDQEKEDPDKSQGDFESKGPGKEITDIAAEAQSLQPKGYTLETTTVKTSVPFLLKHTLREYQHVGLDWLATMYEKRLNGILADEMGLGKTIQTIALLAHLACEKGIWGPHLIVVPTSVMLNWEMEIKKWCPAFKILTYYGTQKERKMKRQGWTKTNAFHICITSYKLVIQDHQSFRRKKWKYFILDEAQNIKNFKSQRWQTLLNFSSQRRLLLTGTPLQNSLMELWSLMHFLMPHVFQSHREFKEWFANPLTGMIEGSHEYNESLIKRLHKVLRPFLLRRLKKDVEKQMPKKYEHVVMCHLSKRQRYLYDDFMSQTKTKETLATGHFMSVINILMQLRKVCNHPSLFDPRPIISPFKMRGITHHIPSLVLNCLNYDPFQDVDIHSLYPTLADMEKDLPAFIAHRVKRLQTTRKMIEEIDDRPDPPPRLAPGKLKPVSIKNLPSVEQPGRLSPATGQLRAASPMISSSSVPVGIPSAPTVNQTSVNSSTVVTSATQTLQATTLQAKILPQSAGQNVVLSSAGHQVSTSQPITVQIHQTEQGARLMIPAGQLSQLPAGFIQIVQTSMGQQIIASTPHTSTSGIVASNMTSTAVSSPATASTISVVNGPPTITTAASTLVSTSVTAVNTQVKYSVQLPSTSTITAVQKPVMKVSPMASSPTPVVSVTGGEKVSKPDITTTTSTTSSRMSVCSERQKEMELKKKSPLFHKMLHEKKQQQRKDSLGYIAKMNKKHCEIKPVYGQDLCQAVNVFRDMEKTHVKDNTWSGIGMAYCHNVHNTKNPKDPGYYWKQTKVLSELIHSPEQYLKEMEEILNRYVFVTPSVMAPQIQMHASHPAPSYLTEQRCREFMFQKELSPKTSCLHRISTCMTVQFPELRLIQYDCGKLQTLDILLRQLKSGGHRVLIFTQMTKMLNILEAFLNFHGHRYLRLDGTTKVEQRQFLMERFNADKRIFCFILSTRSGGIGVNLTGADTVIFYDSDWNPTMDAQAQDRCHRIGQTRDVHIYRLISERTIEENILKKANQKRMLGDMAIEGGNFTTAFFREQTIKELFSEPSGLQSLAKEKEEMERIKEEVDKDSMSKGDMKAEPEAPSDKIAVAQFEKVLAKAEDETDAQAVDLVKAEQKAELAEFDENIPWDEREAEQKKEDELSRAEQEIAMLDKELTPVERYAVGFMEMELEPLTEELDMAEEDIEQAKKDWELSRLKALKEEEERRAELEEDEMLYIYSRDDAYNQVKKKSSKKTKAVKNSTAKSVTPTRVSLARNKPKQVDDSDFTPSPKIKRIVQKGSSGKKNVTPGRGKKIGASKKVLAKAEAVVVSEGDGAINVTMKSKVRESKSSKKSKINIINVTIPNDESEKMSMIEVEGNITKSSLKPNKQQKRQSITSKQLQARAAVAQVQQIQPQQIPLQIQPQIQTQIPAQIQTQIQPQQIQTQQQQLMQQQIAQVQIPQIVASSPQKVQQSITLQPLGSSPQSIQIANSQPTITQLMHQQYQAELAQQQQQANIQVSRNTAIAQHHLIQQPLTANIQQSQPITQNVSAQQRVLNPSITNTQPQLLSASQLQHLKQIISKAAQHNLTKPGPTPTKQQVQVGQAVIQQQQVIQQVSVQAGNLPQTVQHVTQHVVPHQVIAQPQQPVAQVVNQVQQPVQFITHGQSASNRVQGTSAYQPIVSHNSSGQPTIQFIKVNGNSPTTQQQPQQQGQQQAVLQYCVNTAGGSTGAVRVQNLNLVQGPNTQPGVVYLQLAGGKAIPVSLAASSPLSVPVTRMVSSRPLIQQSGVQKIKQVFISDLDQEKMPMWSPPTPPHDDNDRYIDQTMFFLYEPNIMPETQLPPVYIKKEHKKPKIESITTRKQKQRKEEQTRVPRSLFDRPSAQLLKMRREHKLKSGLLKPFRPVPPIVKQPTMDHSADHPEWLIHEDWALLQAVQSLFDVPLNLMVVSPAHHPNWDLVADVVNTCSRVYRSAKQCKLRYEGVIIPREEGRILYDINPKKQNKKTKGIYKGRNLPHQQTKNNRPMRTSQLYLQDNNQAVTMLYSLRFDSTKAIAGKRPPPMKQTLVNPTLKNPKHATVLSENNINYDQPLQPMAVAEIRAQRIQREKKQSQAAAQATAEQQLATQRTQVQQATTVQQLTSAQQTQQTTVTTVTASAGQTVTQVAQTQLQPIQTAVSSAVLTGVVQKTAVGQAVSTVSIPRTAVGTGNIVVNTQGTLQTSANFAAINRRMSQATATSIAQPASTVTAALNPAIRAQRTTPQALTIQEITAIATQAPTQVAQLSTQVARPQLQTTVTAAQLAAAQRITGTSTTGTVQQLAKGFSQQVLSIKQQQTLLAQQKIQQQQQMKMQKLNLTQQQLKQLQQNRGAPKTVITQQVVSSLGQVQKQAQLKTGQIQRQLTPEELIKFKQQQQLAQKAQLSAAQIIPQAQIQHIAQTGTVASGTQLVKTVSAPAGSVPIPVSTVNINVSVPQKTIAKPIVSQLQVQQVPQAKFQHFQQIQRGQLPKQQQKITSISQPVQKTQSIPLNAVQIIQQPSSGSSGRHLTYQLQQIMQQTNKTGSMIISQPTIIATVTQSQQPTSQMVAKVLGTSAAPTSQTIQTIAATPVTVSHVASAATPTPQTSIATLSVAAATGQVSKSVTVTTVTQEPGGAPTTIQVQPVATAVQHHIMQQTTAQVVQPQPQVSQQVTVAQQQKATTLTQASTVTQPFQQIQVTPGTVQQVQTTNVAQPVTTLSSVTVTVTPASQTSSTATLIQQPIVASPTSQNVVQASTVTSQAALAAAAALPQTSTPTLTAVVQSPQQQQIAKPTAPYAMRTRNPPKH